MNPKRKKLIAIDGNSLLYRAFFALPISIATRDGQPTNAVYGFATMLLKLMKEERPDAVAVAWDRAAPTFRHAAFEAYKAHRSEMPAELPAQFPLAKELLAAMGIRGFELDGYEADDILAKMAKEAPAGGYDVLIVTGDKDALQLVNEDVKVMTTRKGITDTVVYDVAAVRERFGVGPERVPDWLGLKGDTSDNIPGVPGVGDKTASELLKTYGSLDDIYANIEKISKPKLKESLTNNEDQARLSRELAVLQPDVPLDVDFGALEQHRADMGRLKALFGRLEFRTLANRLNDPDVFPADTLFVPTESPPTAVPIAPPPALIAIRDNAAYFRECVTADVSAFELNDNEAGLRIAIACSKGYLFWGDLEDVAVREYLNGPNCLKICHNLKDKQRLLAALGIPLSNVIFDTMLASYLLDPGRRSYTVEEEARHYLSEPVPDTELGPATVWAAGVLLRLRDAQTEQLRARNLERLLFDVEMPLSLVLARMEARGTALDVPLLQSYSREMGATLLQLEGEIYELAGLDFNLSSPQQLAGVLFEKLGLTPTKKGKNGFSTDASVLAKLTDQHPIVSKVLAWRELAKLKSTYLDALPRLTDPDTGRVYTYLNQVGTATGRLASEKPNLQNIPVKGEWGLKIRSAFVPGEPDWLLLAADYSQIELRVLASLAGDKDMLAAFDAGLDIHTATAAEVTGTATCHVTPSQRRMAKEVNFGLIYGMSGYGLAERLGITAAEADAYIATYFARYPSIRSYLDEIITQAKSAGYVETVLGRRRYIKELTSSDFNVRRQGERFAVNAVVQGSAADIIKIAMVEIDKSVSQMGLEARMFLQVHDELLLELPKFEKETVIGLVRAGMENAYRLRAKLKVNIATGRNWGELEK